MIGVLSGGTHCLTRIGPHVVRTVSAQPSTARERISTAPAFARIPISDPAAATAQAATIIVLAPKRRARMPEGMARNVPISVKMDMSHEAAWALMTNRVGSFC